MKSRLEGAGVPVSTIPIQPLGMSVLEGSLSPGQRRRVSKATVALSPAVENAGAADTFASDASESPASPSQTSPSTVPPIDVSNFVVTMSMASHSLQVLSASPSPPALPAPSSSLTPPRPVQSPPRFDSRIDGVVPGSPRGMPVWDFKAQMQRDEMVRGRGTVGIGFFLVFFIGFFFLLRRASVPDLSRRVAGEC
jgi:hypothetical protein